LLYYVKLLKHNCKTKAASNEIPLTTRPGLVIRFIQHWNRCQEW